MTAILKINFEKYSFYSLKFALNITGFPQKKEETVKPPISLPLAFFVFKVLTDRQTLVSDHQRLVTRNETKMVALKQFLLRNERLAPKW